MLHLVDSAPVRLDHDELTKKVLLSIRENFSIDFNPMLSMVFDTTGEHRSNRAADTTIGLHSLYLYCDVLEAIPVSDIRRCLFYV